MKFLLSVLQLFFILDVALGEIKSHDMYNVPLLDFTTDHVNKSMLCSTSKCCPIALTFDDGPDGDAGVSDDIINYLHNNKIPAAFFINTAHRVDVNSSLSAQKSIKNIVEYGFDLGTHTIHHKDLGSLSNADIYNEIVGVQLTLNTFISAAPRLSLFRAPFGSPYNFGTDCQRNTVSQIAADAGYFHVGWHINSADYACEENIHCVTDSIFKAVDRGHWGIVLMHFVHRNTANALPSLITGLRERNYEFFTVEKFIQAKYGKFSMDVMNDFNSRNRNPITTCSG